MGALISCLGRSNPRYTSVTESADSPDSVCLRFLCFDRLFSCLLACTGHKRSLPVTGNVTSLTVIIGSNRRKSKAFFEDECNPRSMQMLSKPVSTVQSPETRMLLLKSFNASTVLKLIGHFSNITDLTIVCGKRVRPSSWYSMIRLLESWNRQLISFQLFDRSAFVPILAVDAFYTALNSAAVLKRLTLYSNTLPHRDLPILAQLEYLSYTLSTDSFNFEHSLWMHGQKNAALQIEFTAAISQNEAIIRQLAELNEHLRSRFTRITFASELTINHVRICQHFPSLRSIFIDHVIDSFRNCLMPLANLVHLVHLQLRIDFALLQSDNEVHRLARTPQLPSVRALELHLFSMRSHVEVAQLNIGWTMPNVEVIQLAFHPKSGNIQCQCRHCEVNFSAVYLLAHRAKGRHCLRQIFTPLKRDCSKLRYILHNREHVLGTAEKILARQ